MDRPPFVPGTPPGGTAPRGLLGPRLPGVLLVPALLACEPPPEPPFLCAPAPRLTVYAGEWASGDVCFEDPEGAELKISMSLSNHLPLAQVQLVGRREVRVLGSSPGATTLTITATDPDSLKAVADVHVVVPNRAPAGTLDDVDVPARFGVRIDLSEHFSDPDGQPLGYSASSAAPSVVDVSVSDSLLRLEHSGGEGSARISVTASDGEDSVTTAFDATVVPPELVLSDEFDSAGSLDDWTLDDYSRAKIEDGYLVLTADSAGYNGLAGREFGGTAVEWIVDITLRTTDADAQAGFLVPTGIVPFGAYMFLLGEADIPGLPPVNWIFLWWDSRPGRWITDDWAYGKSGHIRDFGDMEVSLSMTRTGVRATVGGRLLFERDWGGGALRARATGLFLVTRPEDEGDVASSMNRVQLITPVFVEDSAPDVSARPRPADLRVMRR